MLMLYFVSFLRFVRLACSKRESTVVVLIDVEEFTPPLSIAWNLTVYVNDTVLVCTENFIPGDQNTAERCIHGS